MTSLGKSRILVFSLLPLFAQFLQADRFVCPDGVEYVSQAISLNQMKDFLFYGVQPGIDSASECAKFCYETEFCRSAAYKAKEKMCELAYANVIRCKDSAPANRVQSSDSDHDQITAIYCIRCPQGRIEAGTKKLNAASEPTDITNWNGINSLPSVDNDTRTAHAGKSDANQFTPPNGACFVEYEQKALLKSSYAMASEMKLEECKCKCANTWTSPSPASDRCHSFQYFPDRNECVLNSVARSSVRNVRSSNDSSFVDITSQRTSYYDFTCQEASALAALISGYCRKVLPSEGTTVAPDENKKSTSNSSVEDCFDVVEDHLLTGLAGGLEHNVSLDQCKCLCAMSKESGKYDFQCLSIMYYRSEHDCVLNVDDRMNRPDLFRHASNEDGNGGTKYAIAYAGLTCKGDVLTKYAAVTCKQTKPVKAAVFRETTSISIIDATVKILPDKPANEFPLGPLPAPGEKTDDCFVEIPDYILSAKAAAFESNSTLEECKCLCADSVLRYGFTCLSIQYYHDLKTCLLNRKNRIQEPNNFKRVVSSIQHTYLDYLCGDQGTKRESYWKKNCVYQKQPVLPNEPTSQKPDFILPPHFTVTDAPREWKRSKYAAQSKANKRGQHKAQSTRIYCTVTQSAPSTSFPAPQWNPVFAASPPPVPVPVPVPVPSVRGSAPPAESPVRSGPCRYSAFYETEFTGRRMIERIVVADPGACFHNCAQKRCKSANILNFLGHYKYCELFLDSSTEYPHTSLITYNAASVYFDSIECNRL